MKTKILFLMLIVISLAIAACDSNNSQEGVKLKIKAVTNLSEDNASANANELTYQFAQMGIQEVEFEGMDDDDSDDRLAHDDEGDDGEDHDDEISFEGPFVVDLLTGTSIRDFGILGIEPGLYEEIEIELAPVLLDGNSVFIAFTYTPDGGSPMQVQISTKQKLELEIESESGIQVDANVLSTILVLVDLETLVASIDLSQADVDDDGVIRINDTSNTDSKVQIFSNFKRYCHTGEDDDQDSEIEADD
jgi:hypothetical protein